MSVYPTVTMKKGDVPVISIEDDIVDNAEYEFRSYMMEDEEGPTCVTAGSFKKKFDVFHNLFSLLLDAGTGQFSSVRFNPNLARSIYQIIYLDCR